MGPARVADLGEISIPKRGSPAVFGEERNSPQDPNCKCVDLGTKNVDNHVLSEFREILTMGTGQSKSQWGSSLQFTKSV